MVGSLDDLKDILYSVAEERARNERTFEVPGVGRLIYRLEENNQAIILSADSGTISHFLAAKIAGIAKVCAYSPLAQQLGWKSVGVWAYSQVE